jgi:hypothetical protein
MDFVTVIALVQGVPVGELVSSLGASLGAINVTTWRARRDLDPLEPAAPSLQQREESCDALW